MLGLSSTTLAANSHYAIFIDAGSSGSRLHIFQYDESTSLPVISDIFSEKTNSGLSTYVEHPENVGEALKNIFNDAVQFLQQENVQIATVPVNVLGTAGMRLLTDEQQNAIYAAVTNYLKNHYAFPIQEVKTISGQMEGLYGWLDINYLLGNFQYHQSTVGSIDMGGASTQIAFATQEPSGADEISIEINHEHYTVFSKSFLGLGQDKARASMLADAMANNCYPRNYAFAKTSLGDFNMASCNAIYASILRKQHVRKQIISLTGQSFIAYSGIYFTDAFFNTTQHPDQFSLEARIQTVCNQTWSELQKEYPDIAEKYLSTYCANGVYQDRLIFNAYKIQSSQLTVANQINQTDIDWTLGAMLYGLIQKEMKL